MRLKRMRRETSGNKSIFRSLFVPLFLIMFVQAMIFYFAAVYGGIEDSLNKNAADILSERLINRKNEIEAQFTGKWANLDECRASLQTLYQSFTLDADGRPFESDTQTQIEFLHQSADTLIRTLRRNEVNGIFLILNDRSAPIELAEGETMYAYGLCIRDMDQNSNYADREDLLIERSPSSIVDALNCSLDSWWESKYTFSSPARAAYYIQPLNAAWAHLSADGSDLAYFAGAHRISSSDPEVISYSLPLMGKDGYPFGVLGVEITTRHLASLLPYQELNKADKSIYVLAISEADSSDCVPIVGTGALYSRLFSAADTISTSMSASTGGFTVVGRGNAKLYGEQATLKIYNNNNPFEHSQLTLLALVEERTLFAFINQIKTTLFIVALFSLALGVAGIFLVSRRFAAPITDLAGRVRGMKKQPSHSLGRLGIDEIDQLVEAIEELNRNVSKNSARTEFFSRMSHDMRTPMNAIINFSSAELLSGTTSREKDDYFRKIHSSGEYLLGLINEVLDMTKIESDKTMLQCETIRASQLCAKTLPIITMLADKKKLNFECDINIPDDLYVNADEQHINQVVMNLLSNAVKFTPEGGNVRLTFNIIGDVARMGTVQCLIVVSDTGIGMSREFVKRMYTPFEQEGAQHEGTGLGLSIAKKLVELMGGTIECESHKDKGTTFIVRLPLTRGGENATGEAHAQVRAAKTYDALKDMLVLVCEDNAINTQIVVNLLKRKGIRTRLAADGRQAVDAFTASAPGEFDAILMDIQMPVLDGLSATREIRALSRPDAKTVPIIAMTANAFAQDERASEDAGMNAHLAKPVEPNRLFDTLLTFMRAHE